MPETFTRWDVTDYLRTEEDIRYYLEAAADEDPGDGSLIRAALNDIARAQNMSQLAREVGMTREGLYKALSDKGNPHVCHGASHHPRFGDATADHGIRNGLRRVAVNSLAISSRRPVRPCAE